MRVLATMKRKENKAETARIEAEKKLTAAERGNRYMEKAWPKINDGGINNEELHCGKFQFMGVWPPELLPVIQGIAESEGDLIPAWCHSVLVWWNDEMDCAADSLIEYDYRRMTLRIGATFFNSSDGERVSYFRHELIHNSTNVPMIYAENVIEELLQGDESKAFRKRVLKDMRERHESCVVDLLQCIENKLANQSGTCALAAQKELCKDAI